MTKAAAQQALARLARVAGYSTFENRIYHTLRASGKMPLLLLRNQNPERVRSVMPASYRLLKHMYLDQREVFTPPLEEDEFWTMVASIADDVLNLFGEPV